MDAVHKYGTKMFIQLHHPGRNYGLGGEQPVSAPRRSNTPAAARRRARLRSLRSNRSSRRS
ncbi:MAG: hypothetical protein M0037_06815 [Betaproteobacteria bacterium]|nr:hypothetical protein [Betaproteobacteria bacterium]